MMTRLVRQLPSLLLLLLAVTVAESLPQTGAEHRQANATNRFEPVVALRPWPVWAPLDPRVSAPLLLAGAGGWWSPHSHSAPPGTVKRSQCCGRANYRKGRIVGGGSTRPNEYPWMVSLEVRENRAHFCGGSLINDRYVLTAAHCVAPPPFGIPVEDVVVVLAKHAESEDSGRDNRVDIAEAIIHPDFNSELYQDDVALLKLSVTLNLPAGRNLIAPICLPTAGDYRYSRVEAIGWGVTQEGGQSPDDLQSVEMVTLNNERCGVLNAPRIVTEDMICAGPKNVVREGFDACQGDSGSPLMTVDRRRRHTIIGIVSWGVGCARARRPGVYARVTHFMDWIIANTADAHYC